MLWWTFGERRVHELDLTKITEEVETCFKLESCTMFGKIYSCVQFIISLFQSWWTHIEFCIFIEYQMIWINDTPFFFHCILTADQICRVYEIAVKSEPSNEELLSHLFMAYVRVGDYKNQQQTAMKLYKLKPKNPYYFWAVMSYVMQVKILPLVWCDLSVLYLKLKQYLLEIIKDKRNFEIWLCTIGEIHGVRKGEKNEYQVEWVWSWFDCSCSAACYIRDGVCWPMKLLPSESFSAFIFTWSHCRAVIHRVKGMLSQRENVLFWLILQLINLSGP